MAATKAPGQDVRPTRRLIVAAFGVTLLGIVGLTLLSARYLWRLADTSLHVAERDAPAVQELASIRGDAQRARSMTREAVTAVPERRAVLRAKKDEAFADIDRLLAEHWRLEIDPPATRDSLIRSRIGLEMPVNAAFNLLDQADAAGALALLDRTRPDYERLDHAIQDDIISHSEDTRAVTERVHEALHRFVYQSLGMMLIGVLGALILLRLALGSLRLLVASMAARQTAAEERAAELDAFAARVAHDLRSPLTAMRLSLGLAARHSEGKALENIQRSNATVALLDRMIDEMLAFARSGARPDRAASCDVGAVVQAVVAELQPRAEAAAVSLATSLPGGAQAAIGEMPLRMVAFNVIENAIKYIGTGPERRVEITARRAGVRVAVVVRDTGIGISDDALPHLFEPFFRGVAGGTGYGLGLATVKRLVEAHSGEIRVESALGAGTTVTLELQMAEAG